MRTFAQLTERYEGTVARLAEILSHVQQGVSEEQSAALAAEVIDLVIEQRELQAAIELFRSTAQHLMAADCHGPH